MTEILPAVALGIIQGVTEFLPISSSGHLRIVQDFFGWTDQFGLAFDTLLHLATLFAVVIYFRTDLRRMTSAVLSRSPEYAEDRHLAWLILVATITTGFIGMIGGDWFTDAPTFYVGIAFVITSITLVAADRLSNRAIRNASHLHWSRALIVGLAQGVAIMPGISRSGATMAAGLSVGLDREQAARFSFLLSAPIVLLAFIHQMTEVLVQDIQLPGVFAMIAGFVAAAITGYMTIATLMSFIKRHTFVIFAVYTALLGMSVIIWQMTV